MNLSSDNCYKCITTYSKKCADEINFSFFFPERCRKLPKGLKDWQAFLDLKKRIDDFSESCPLLEMMTNKAMKQRHWDRISELTGTPFDVESDSFCLRNIMEAPLLKNKDDIEVLCTRVPFFHILNTYYFLYL